MIGTKRTSSTIQELKAIPVVKEDYLGNRWRGIQHGELVETIHDQLQVRNIMVEAEGWFPSGLHLGRLDGQMRLRIPNLEPEDGMGYCLGVQHSNLGDHSLKFAVGAHIFICSNGLVVGDYAVKRKHTLGVCLPEIIGRGIETFLQRVTEVPLIINRLKSQDLSTNDVDRHLMQAGREGIMCWSRIGMVDAEYNKPTFRDHNEKTAWGLYNAFTYVIQRTPPQYQIQSINRFREILTEPVAEVALN